MKSEGTVAEVLAGAARFAVVCGDAVEVMRTLPDGCAHVTYCDPPYGLSAQSTADVVECLRAWLAGEVYTHGRGGMMGHEWDSFVPGPEAWREVHRALRPGGYCVAYSSTRTVDLLGIAVRLAGFDIREGMAWVFGSGFPKSLDVSKAIDAAEGAEREHSRTVEYRSNVVLNAGIGNRTCVTCGRTAGGAAGNCHCDFNGAPVTEAAAQWEGYGTTTKPCFEPVVVARKPLDGTVARNVTTHGCGALNIDAARITSGGASPSVARREGAAKNGAVPGQSSPSGWAKSSNLSEFVAPRAGEQLGRFPAALALVHSEGCEMVGTRRVLPNGQRRFRTVFRAPQVGYNGGGGPGTMTEKAGGMIDSDGMESCDEWRCVDGCAVAELARQSGESASSDRPRRIAARGVTHAKGAESDHVTGGFSDSGTAARFFWQAKAASSDRLAFLTCTPGCSRHETIATARDARKLTTCPACGAAVSRHEHSTVKPLDLARYHARLLSLPEHVAPVALVPYCGSGPEARALLEVGFRVIAVDLDPRHCAMTRHRLSQPLTPPQPKRAKRPRPTPAAAPSQPLAAPAAPAVVAEAPTPAAVATKPARGQRVAPGQLSLWGAP